MHLLYLFGRSVAVVLFSPELGLHLQPDVLKVNSSVHRLHVTLGHIIACRLPVAAVWEIRQLLPGGKGKKCQKWAAFQFYSHLFTHSEKTSLKDTAKAISVWEHLTCRDFLLSDLTCLGLRVWGFIFLMLWVLSQWIFFSIIMQTANSWGGSWWMPHFPHDWELNNNN